MRGLKVIRPGTVEEALACLAENPAALPLAAGTDLVVRLKDGLYPGATLLDLSGLHSLRFIEDAGAVIHIGPLTTHSDIIVSRLLGDWAPVLVEAASTVGAKQIQNRGTIGGNLGTASPAGDTLPALLCHDARITLSSASGERVLPVDEFLLGPGKTALQKGELITRITIDKAPESPLSFYKKLGSRNALAISIASVAVVLGGVSCDTFESARVALGAVAPTPIRARECEEILAAGPLTESRIDAAARAAASAASPISDLRASAEYRRAMIAALLKQGLSENLGRCSA